MLVCLVMLLTSFVAVLLLNISMAQGSFVLGGLQQESSELADTQQVLQQALDAQSAPAALAERALRIGMVPASTAAFLRPEDGKILGVAEPAPDSTRFSVVAQGPTSKVSSAPTTTKPEPGTTVTTKGPVTTTTTVVITGDRVETTVTQADSRTGETTSRTESAPMPIPSTRAGTVPAGAGGNARPAPTGADGP